MSKCKSLLFFLTLLFTATPLFGDGYDLESEVITGYNFLFDEGDNGFYRSHNDLTDGATIDRFYFALSAKQDTGWFDKLTVDADLANRLESDKGVRFSLKKNGKWAAAVRYTFFDDYFLDPYYNFGANNRDLTRSSLQADFQWVGIKHFIFDAGYGFSRNKGSRYTPGFYWGDIFKIPINRRDTYEELRAGVTFSYEGFKARYQQSWLRITDDSRYDDGPTSRAGFSSYNVFALGGERSGKIKTDMPVYSVAASYTGANWSAGFTHIFKDGQLDDQVIDLRKLFFETGAFTDFAVQTNGRADLPETKTDIHADFRPWDFLDLAYDFSRKSIRTDTTMELTLIMRLYRDPALPIETSEVLDAPFLYKNTYRAHTFTAQITPVDPLRLTAAYQRTDGELFQETLEEYHADRYDLGARYKFSAGTEVSAAYRHENIDHPLFPIIGRKRDDFTISAYHPLTSSVSANFQYRDARVTNTDIDMKNRIRMLDISVQFNPRPWGHLGVGYDRLDLNDANAITFWQSNLQTTRVEDYDSVQNAVYAFAGFDEKHRISGNISLYYLQDDGLSMPLSRWNPAVNLQVNVRKNLYVLATGRYFNYREDLFTGHNYDYNQLTFSLRWKY